VLSKKRRIYTQIDQFRVRRKSKELHSEAKSYGAVAQETGLPRSTAHLLLTRDVKVSRAEQEADAALLGEVSEVLDDECVFAALDEYASTRAIRA